MASHVNQMVTNILNKIFLSFWLSNVLEPQILVWLHSIDLCFDVTMRRASITRWKYSNKWQHLLCSSTTVDILRNCATKHSVWFTLRYFKVRASGQCLCSYRSKEMFKFSFRQQFLLVTGEMEFATWPNANISWAAWEAIPFPHALDRSSSLLRWSVTSATSPRRSTDCY